MGDEGRSKWYIRSSFHIMLLILPIMLFVFAQTTYLSLCSCFHPACSCSMLLR